MTIRRTKHQLWIFPPTTSFVCQSPPSCEFCNQCFHHTAHCYQMSLEFTHQKMSPFKRKYILRFISNVLSKTYLTQYNKYQTRKLILYVSIYTQWQLQFSCHHRWSLGLGLLVPHPTINLISYDCALISNNRNNRLYSVLRNAAIKVLYPDVRLLPRCWWNRCSSGQLHGVMW